MDVIKRDGSKVSFDLEKIHKAIEKANNTTKEMSEEDINNVVDKVSKQIKDNIDVEEIQNIVETALMKSKFKQTAKQYILYRDMRTRNRDNRSKLLKDIAKKINGTNIVNQNANVDEMSFGGRKGEASNELMKWFALNNCMSQKSKENHLNNEIYIHDLDSYAVGQHNCLSIPFDHLLANGFNTRQADIRPAGSVSTAFQLVAVIFQLQSLQQFGGVSATHLDWTMVPYVRKSFRKHYKDGIIYLESSIDCSYLHNIEENSSIEDERYKKYENIYNYAYNQTISEINQSVEGMYHNLNTLQSRSGNQLPFTSINYGTCTLAEGRLITKSLLDNSIKGIGKLHRTAIFPCGIFQYMKGVNDKPGTPNYDLYKLALKSTSKRLYPNYANVDWSGNAGYDKNDPKTYFSTMGALAGHEHLYIRVNDSDVQDVSMKDLYEMLVTQEEIYGRPAQIYYNQPIQHLKGNKHIQDHSFDFEAKPGVYKITYIPEDVTYIGSSANICRRLREHRCSIKCRGKLDAGCSFNDTDLTNYKFEVIEYTDDFKEKEKEFILSQPNINFKGIAQRFYKCIGQNNSFISDRPDIKMNPNVPQSLIHLDNFNIKVLDRDNKWVKIKHIFKNDKFNTPLMMHIRYLENENEFTLSCTEDHPLWTGNGFTKASDLHIGDYLYRADGVKLPITMVSWHWERCDSYDIGTESGTFIGSDIIMHNCRTANGYDINAEPGQNPQLKDGRGNICPVTIILPTLAMEAKELDGDLIENFFRILDTKITEAKDMLIERFNYICNQSAESAKFMYENNLMYGYKPEEGIRSALKHGTLALGQIGLAETLQILISKNQTSKEGLELAKRIEQLFKDRCAEFKKQWYYLTAKPSNEDIKSQMIILAEKELGRELTQEELKEIQKYKHK